jgi:DNA-binding transcriptional ArsR family regulator
MIGNRIDDIEALLRAGRVNGTPARELAEQIFDLSSDPAWAKATLHPVRAQILQLLRDGPLSPNQASQRIDGYTLGTIAYHFRTLQRLGLITETSRVPKRGAIEHFYALSRPGSAATG